MSTPTSNTTVTADTTSMSGLSIGIIIGGIVLAMIIIGVVIYVVKKRRNAGGYVAPSMPSPGGPNAGMPGPTNSNMNSNRLSGNGNNAGRTTA